MAKFSLAFFKAVDTIIEHSVKLIFTVMDCHWEEFR